MDDAANEGFLRCRVGPLGFSMDAPSNTLFALTFEVLSLEDDMRDDPNGVARANVRQT